MFNTLVSIGNDNEVSNQITEVSLLCMYLITERISKNYELIYLFVFPEIKYDEIENIKHIQDLGHFILKNQSQPELQDLTAQIFKNLCEDEKTYMSILETVDLGKLGVKGNNQTNNSETRHNILSSFHPLPYYESSNSILEMINDSNIQQQNFKKPPRIMTQNGPSTESIKSGLKDTNVKGIRTPEVRTSKQDFGGRRYTSKEKGPLPNSHNVNKTIDTSTLQTNNVNSRNSNKRIPTRDNSVESVQDKGERNKSKKPGSANFQLPTLNNSVGRPLFKNQ